MANDDSTQPAPPDQPPRRRWALWPWLILLVAAALGAGLGISLGQRQGGPLASPSGPTTVSSRPTIVIAVPSPSASAVVARPTPGSPTAEREYVVEPGDTLRSIAQQQYGDAALWQRVYQANRDVIGPDPNTLRPGMRLRIPAS